MSTPLILDDLVPADYAKLVPPKPNESKYNSLTNLSIKNIVI